MMRGQNKSLGLLWTQVDTRLMIKFVLGFITGRITSMPNKTKSVEKDIEERNRNWEQIAYTQLCVSGRITNIDCDLYDHPEYTLINETAKELAWAEAVR